MVRGGYKTTDAGVIPADWDSKKMAVLCSQIIDGTHHTPTYRKSGIPFLRVTDIKNQVIDFSRLKFISDDEHQELIRRCRPEKGDLLLSKNGTIGLTKIVDWDWEFSVFVSLALLKIKHPLRVEYLNQLFKSDFFLNQLKAHSKQGTVTNLHLEEIRKFNVPLPSQKEQKAIAGALSDVDALIESLEKIIAKNRAIKTATMQELLTGKTRLPGFSENWDEKSFDDIFQFGSTATNSRADLTTRDDTLYFHYGDLHTKFKNWFDVTSTLIPRVPRDLCKNATTVLNGDWIMADASEDIDGIGCAIEVRGLRDGQDAVAGLHTFLLREKIDAFADGFKAYLGNSEQLKKQYRRVMTGMKVFGVSKTALKNLVLPVPPKDEQAAIVTILSDMDNSISVLAERLKQTKNLKQGMMQELLTGRTRLVS